MFKMPQVGDHVELVDPGSHIVYTVFQGKHAVITSIVDAHRGKEALVKFDFDKKDDRDKWRKLMGSDGCYASRWKVLDENIKDLSSLVTRNGYKILAIHQHPDHIEATIKLRNRELTLRYGLTGHFYRHMECPVDLVEAK